MIIYIIKDCEIIFTIVTILGLLMITLANGLNFIRVVNLWEGHRVRCSKHLFTIYAEPSLHGSGSRLR
jgi:hypothetical protein